MKKKYLNLSPQIQEYIEFAISDKKLTEKEVELIKRKAQEFGDDPDEVELVLSKILTDLNSSESEEEKKYIEVEPKYGPIDGYFNGIKNYFNFKGRASRAEFWFFILFNYLILFIVFFGVGTIGEDFGKDENNIALFGLFIFLFPLFSITPFLSLCSRRLHDVNLSGWYALIPFYNLILFCKPGTSGANKYGQDPYQKMRVEKKSGSPSFFDKTKSNVIETIGGTMFAIGATAHEAIEFKVIDYHELDQINKWLWLIGGILIVIPRTYKFIFNKKN
jgi:uncharacterized membrane protein YhaH (DUF805 family)